MLEWRGADVRGKHCCYCDRSLVVVVVVFVCVCVCFSAGALVVGPIFLQLREKRKKDLKSLGFLQEPLLYANDLMLIGKVESIQRFRGNYSRMPFPENVRVLLVQSRYCCTGLPLNLRP